MTARFSDHLFPGHGVGLVGFASGTGWHYARHDYTCRPGLWRVAVYALDWDEMAAEFYTALGTADAVVDDFGTLRRVQ